MKIVCCWLYAISKYGYPPTLPQTFRAIEEMAAMGFRYVELEGLWKQNNLRAMYRVRHEVRHRCGDLGVRVVNFCPILPDTVSLDARKRRKSWDEFEIGLETALDLGCELVQLDSFTPPLKFVGDAPYKKAIQFGQRIAVRVDRKFDWRRQWDAIVESVAHCAARAKRAGLRLIMEPRVGEMISNTDAMLRLMDHVGSDNFFAVLDTGHLHAQKELLPLSVEKLGRRIAYVHASDNDGRTNEHLALGDGKIDWPSLFAALRKHNFNGYVGVDVGGVPRLAQAYVRSRKFLERLV